MAAQAGANSKTLRTAVFIDGDNLDVVTHHQLKIALDYSQFASALHRHFGDIAQLYLFYSILPAQKNKAKLQRTPPPAEFKVKTAPLFKAAGSIRTNIDVIIASDILAKAESYDRAVLISGDNDFVPTIQAVKSLRKQAIVVGIPLAVGHSLRASADAFVNLEELLDGTFRGLPRDLDARVDERTEALRALYFEKGYRTEAYAEVRRLIHTAQHRIWLADRYVTTDVIRLLNSAHPIVQIRVWTEKARGEDFEPEVKKIRAAGRHIEIYYVGKELHGRFLIVDEAVWHFCHSLKDLGSSDAVIQLLDERRAIQDLERRLNQLATT